MRAATQRLEQDLRKSEARADRYGRQRDEARDDADQLRGDVKRLRRERDEARKDAATSERALAALRQKLDRDTAAAAQRDATPVRPAKRGRHSPADEPVDERAEERDVTTTSEGARLQAQIDADDEIKVRLVGHRGTVSNCYVAADGSERRQFVVSARGDVVTCTLCAAEELPSPSYKCRWTVTSETRASYGATIRKALIQHSGCRPAVCKAKRHKDFLRSAMGLAAASDGEESDDDAVSKDEPPATTGAVRYPVETLVEARFQGGAVFYPALVVAVRDGGRTLDLKYTDGDSEERVPLDLVRPLAARQRSAPAAAVPEGPPAAPTSKPEAAAPRWTAEEEKQLRKLVNELGDRESWSAIAARFGSVRSAAACEFHWKYSMKGETITAAKAPKNYATKACEVRRGNGPWRRFASQADAFRKIPALTQSSLSGLINESRDGRQRSTCHSVRGEYEARYEVSHGPVAVFGGAARSRALSALAPGPWPRSDDPETTELQGAAFDVSASDEDSE